MAYPDCVVVVVVVAAAAAAKESGCELVICCAGCAATCPLDTFVELTNSVIPTDWHAECNTLTPSS